MITISPLLPLNFTRVLTRVLGAGMPCCVRQGAAQGALTTDADHRRVARACLAARASRGRACAGPHGARHGARGRPRLTCPRLLTWQHGRPPALHAAELVAKEAVAAAAQPLARGERKTEFIWQTTGRYGLG